MQNWRSRGGRRRRRDSVLWRVQRVSGCVLAWSGRVWARTGVSRSRRWRARLHPGMIQACWRQCGLARRHGGVDQREREKMSGMRRAWCSAWMKREHVSTEKGVAKSWLGAEEVPGC
jgi:hypothetical protein